MASESVPWEQPGPARLRVLVADDDPAIRLVLRHRLEAEGYVVDEAADGVSALQALRSGQFDVAVMDIIMPGRDGLDVLSTAHAEALRTQLVVITAVGTMSNAIEAMKRGAYDYLTKPFDNLDVVVNAVGRAAEMARMERSAEEPGHGGADDAAANHELIGRSPAMQQLYKLVGRVLDSDATVLLRGESGTGKELVARAIHFRSRRSREPFVAVNCSAIPHGLLESELFGHERGSFTGAAEPRAGKFELAGQGTLFLDEVGDLPLDLQPKLLRVLQEREFTRVGGSVSRPLQARIIAATNQDLEAAVAAGRFREDLYFRLRVIPIELPPLRARREDIGELADYFVARSRARGKSQAVSLSPEARLKLAGYDWPGNVRELENTVLRAALLAPAGTIRAADIQLPSERTHEAPPTVQRPGRIGDLVSEIVGSVFEAAGSGEPREVYRNLISEAERSLIERVLERTGGNQVRAARILGINRNTLRKKILGLAIKAAP